MDQEIPVPALVQILRERLATTKLPAGSDLHRLASHVLKILESNPRLSQRELRGLCAALDVLRDPVTYLLVRPSPIVGEAVLQMGGTFTAARQTAKPYAHVLDGVTIEHYVLLWAIATRLMIAHWEAEATGATVEALNIMIGVLLARLVTPKGS